MQKNEEEKLWKYFYDKAPVWFVGAGPGDPDLITVKGKKLISVADFILYAGSLVPFEVVKCAKKEACLVDSSPLTLEETHLRVSQATSEKKLVARVHTGDPALYGAIREQKILLEQQGITSQVIPGVSAAFAAAAAGGISFTVPEKVQTLTITRIGVRTPMPEKQAIREVCTGGSLAIYLSAQHADHVQAMLEEGGVSGDVPVLVVYRASWPDEIVIWSCVNRLADDVKKHNIKRQAVFLVLPGENGKGSNTSRLYSSDFIHSFRE